MNKILTAVLASLMLAGALCALDGVTSPNSGGTFVIIGDGGGPVMTSSRGNAVIAESLVHLNQF